MLQKFASTAFVVGTVLALIPAAGLARDHGSFGGGRSTRSYSGGSRNYAPRGSYGGSRREYSGGRSYYGGGYVAPRYYSRPVRRYYGGSVYLGFGDPYGYAYDPGYVYDPGYAYAPGTCAQGSYDAYGNWVPSAGCYSSQQPPPNYNYNQQQYPQQQPYYDPNQPQYPQQQQNYRPPYQPQR